MCECVKVDLLIAHNVCCMSTYYL